MCSVSCLLFSIQNIQIADSILLFYSTQFFLFWPREKTRFNPFRPKAQFEIYLETIEYFKWNCDSGAPSK